MTQFNDILEKTTRIYSATIRDEDDVAIPAASLTTLTLTLYSVQTKAIINTRNAQNVLNLNNVTVSVDGELVWTMQPADNAIIAGEEALEFARHRALFQWTWGGGKAGKHEVTFVVRNLGLVT